jgi:branched-chain amino acid transport system permease protein
MSKNLKTALFSTLLVLAVAYPVLGLKLTTVGIRVEVHGASPATLWTIAACALAMFVWQLVRERVTDACSGLPRLPTLPGRAGNFLTLPSTQRWAVLALVVVGLACLRARAVEHGAQVL